MSHTTQIPAPPLLRYAAGLISWLFHPLLLGLYMCTYLVYGPSDYFMGIGARDRGQTVLIYIINSVFFPLVTVLLCKALGFIRSLYVNTQKERIIIYSITMIFFFWTFYVFHNKPGMPPVMAKMALGIFLAVSADFVANIYLKVSMHATGAGGMAGLLVMTLFTSSAFIGYPIAIAILIAGLVCTARLLVSDHSMKDIVIGLVSGFLGQWLAFYFLS
jgi:hypothetical protein